jgi:hypothetical protein
MVVVVSAASPCKNQTYSPGSKTYLSVEKLEGRLRDEDHPADVVNKNL